MHDNVYRNEFAAVQVGRDESGNGVRLRIQDLISGKSIYLDPLELEALTWMDHRRFAALLDPSWREGVEEQRALAEAQSDLQREAERVLRQQAGGDTGLNP
jgi:hypothetical protein